MSAALSTQRRFRRSFRFLWVWWRAAAVTGSKKEILECLTVFWWVVWLVSNKNVNNNKCKTHRAEWKDIVPVAPSSPRWQHRKWSSRISLFHLLHEKRWALLFNHQQQRESSSLSCSQKVLFQEERLLASQLEHWHLLGETSLGAKRGRLLSGPEKRIPASWSKK